MNTNSQRGALHDMVPSKHPVFGFSTSVEVTIALSKAGAVGVWGATRNTPEEIREGLAKIAAEVGDAPYAIDLVMPSGMPEDNDRDAIESQIPEGHRRFVAGLRGAYKVPDDGLPGMRSRFVRSEQMAEEQLAVALAAAVPIVAMGVGSPAPAVARCRDAGKTVIALVGTVEHARRALEAGCNILVAQGSDAGGHTGTVGTFSLVPRVVDLAGDVPVLCAGGVTTGRHIAAAFCLGAQGVWSGTAWLPTVEHDLSSVLLRQIDAATESDTVISRADSGKTLRQIRTAWSQAWAAEDAPAPLPMPFQDILVGDLLGSIDRHRVERLMHTPAGQGVGYAQSGMTVKEVVDRMTTEAEKAAEMVVHQ